MAIFFKPIVDCIIDLALIGGHYRRSSHATAFADSKQPHATRSLVSRLAAVFETDCRLKLVPFPNTLLLFFTRMFFKLLNEAFFQKSFLYESFYKKSYFSIFLKNSKYLINNMLMARFILRVYGGTG
jgi:hypothetical protein